MEKIFILWQVKTGHFVSMFLKSYFYTIMFQGWQICQYTNMNSSWHKNICIFLDKGLKGVIYSNTYSEARKISNLEMNYSVNWI